MKKKNKELVLSVAFIVAVTTTVQPFNESSAKAETIEKQEIIYHEPPNKEKITTYIISDQTPLERNSHSTSEVTMSKQAQAILPYIERAEISQSGEDVHLAQLLMEKLPENEKNELSERLNRIVPTVLINDVKEVEEAETYVTLAEQDINNEHRLKEAQKRVVSLKMSEEKMDLIERLNSIYQVLIKEKEQERKKT